MDRTPPARRGSLRGRRSTLAVALCLLSCRAQTEGPAPRPVGAKVRASPGAEPVGPPPGAEGGAERPPAVLAPEAYAPPSSRADVEPAPAPSASASASPPGKKRRYLVAAMGDSLTDTRFGGGRYLAFLAERCPESRFDSYGKGGEMVNQMRRRFVKDILDRTGDPGKPAYTDVIVFGGVNDLYSDLTAGRTVAKIRTDLSAMYAAARARGLRVIAITVAPWGGFRKYWNEARQATTEELDAWILAQGSSRAVDVAVDSYPLLACGRELCPELTAPFHDGLHFGPEGHRKLADALFRGAFSDCR